MSDTSPPAGKGKAVSSFAVTFIAVYACFILKTHYKEFFDALETAGMPDNMILAGMISTVSGVAVWWTSSDLVSICISIILDFKKIYKVWKTPTP